MHNRTLYERVNQTSGLDSIAGINVGSRPITLAIGSWNAPETGEEIEVVYVTNYDDDSVSVITAENNTKIADIPVGNGPVAIDTIGPPTRGIGPPINPYQKEVVYVANSLNGSISVISIYQNNTWNVTEIPVAGGVGSYPTSMAIGQAYDRERDDEMPVVYVAGATSVSVIDRMTNKIIAELVIEKSESTISTAGGKAYVDNIVSGGVSVISIENNTWNVTVMPVGKCGSVLGNDYSIIDPETHEEIEAVYVAGSNSVCIISGETNNVIGEIPVGEAPIAIASGFNYRTDPETHEKIYYLYVANRGSDSVSVISLPSSTENNWRTVAEIPVGEAPSAISIPPDKYKAYVVNTKSDSVSVISLPSSTENNWRTVAEIPVGEAPIAIGTVTKHDTVYVTNSDSDSVSVIDATADKVVAGVTFQINPFNSGYIVCTDPSTPSPDDLTRPSPLGEYIYVYSGNECVAKPNEGFEFLSWEENLEGNSTQPISVSRPSSPWDSFVLTIGAPFGYKPDKPEATLNVAKFGIFTANFREAPPPLPQEFWVQMYAVIGTVVTALFVPSIVGWFKSKRDAKKLNYFHKQIASLYQDGKLDENDIDALDRLRDDIADTYSEGKINDKHYESLKNEMSILYEKIFRNRIKGLLKNNLSNKKATEEQLAQIKTELEYAYSEGKISQKHYDLLNKTISDLESKERDTS